MDLSTLRAEIKTWEREFRTTHGRDPSIQEIKDRPGMAEKYKLYKKLSKQSTASSSASTSAKPFAGDHRRTPPQDSRRPPTSSLLLSASNHRAVRIEGLTLTSNPFSPVKQRGKDRHPDKEDLSPDSPRGSIPLLPSSTSRTHGNPFKTPSKPRSRTFSFRKTHTPVLEEDPFPLIDSHTLASSSQPRLPQQPHIIDKGSEQRIGFDNSFPRSGQPNAKPIEDAVTRARKRLRGEPVSPSPVKEKRARTVSEVVYSGSSDRGSLFETLQAAQDEQSDEEHSRRSEDEFIGETPVKRAKGGKAFVKLFDEALPVSTLPQPRQKASKPGTKIKSADPGLLAFGFGLQGRGKLNGKQRALSPAPMDEDNMDVDRDILQSQARVTRLKAPNFQMNGATRSVNNSSKPPTRNGILLAKAMLPGKSDLFDDGSSTSSMTERVGKLAIKRRSSAAEAPESGSAALLSSQHSPSFLLPLLPPSPPSLSSSGSKYTGDKGKTSTKGLTRKKTKLLEQLIAADDSDGGKADETGDEDENLNIKEIPWHWDERLRQNRRGAIEGAPSTDDGVLTDSEADFGMTTYRSTAMSSAEEEPEKFEVNLPEHLRQVLAISPHKSKALQDDEEKLARGLIYGRREGHYDATRGGEIWGVGEVGEENKEEEFDLDQRRTRPQKTAEDDDDWEGEPVPWEVGEL